MKSLRSLTLILCGLLVALQGCGGPSQDQVKKPTGPAPKAISEAELNLQKAREELTLLQQNNDRLAQRCEVLTARTKELEEIVREKEEKKAPVPPVAAAGNDARIELMGAKAIAEYRAKQLSVRLDTLSKDLERKDQELETIRRDAQQKEAQLESLRQSLEQLRSTAEAHTADLTRRMEQLTRQVQERTEATKKLQKEIEDKTALLESLKSAVADAGKLKSYAESHSSQLQTQLNETLAQLQAARAESQQRTQELTELRNQLATLKHETEQWRGVAERFRAEAERYGQAVQDLQAQASELTARLKALEPAEPQVLDEDYVPPLTEELTTGLMAKMAASQPGQQQ